MLKGIHRNSFRASVALSSQHPGTRQYLLWFLIIASWNLVNAFPTTEEILPIKNSFEELRERYRRDARDTITCDGSCTCQCSSTGVPQTSEITSVGTTSTSTTSTSTTVPVPALAVRQQALPQQAPRRLVPVPALAFLQQVLRQPVLVPAQQALQQPVPVPAQQALQQLVLVLAQQAPQLQQQRRRARLLLAVL
ncbi:unnamed protein product, partial [Rotaria magnacalcarata]